MLVWNYGSNPEYCPMCGEEINYEEITSENNN
jgi:hypothetical protein